MPCLNKIKFNYRFATEIIEEFSTVLLDSFIFPNLRTLEFQDITFTFRNKADLNSFIEKEYKTDHLLLSNVSCINMHWMNNFK